MSRHCTAVLYKRRLGMEQWLKLQIVANKIYSEEILDGQWYMQQGSKNIESNLARSTIPPSNLDLQYSNNQHKLSYNASTFVLLTPTHVFSQLYTTLNQVLLRVLLGRTFTSIVLKDTDLLEFLLSRRRLTLGGEENGGSIFTCSP